MAKKTYICNVKMFAFGEFKFFENSWNKGVIVIRKSQVKFRCSG